MGCHGQGLLQLRCHELLFSNLGDDKVGMGAMASRVEGVGILAKDSNNDLPTKRVRVLDTTAVRSQMNSYMKKSSHL